MNKQLEKVNIIPEHETLPAVVTPMTMIDRAVAAGASIEMIEKLMALQERFDANHARKAFDNAMAAAKAKIPMIGKNREVDFTSAKGRTHYKYEDLGEIARQVNPILAEHGLSYRFRTASPINEPVSVTCIVSHRDGHFEENTLCAGRDDSGNKNPIQAIGSTLTYLQRMTLKAALGLAVAHDDDGKSSAADEPYVPPEGSLSPAQIEELRLCLQAKGATEKAFVAFAKVKRIEDIPEERFEACKTSIANFRKG